MNFYKRHLGDYAKDAGHLSMLEHGAYTLLLDRYYTTEKPLATLSEAYRVCRARSAVERAAVDAVLAEFFVTDGDLFLNRRAEEEIAKAAHQRTVNQEIGKRGGRPKQTESGIDRITDSVSVRNPSQTPDSRLHKTPPPPEGEFGRFWQAYPATPRKVARKQCLAKWQAQRCEPISGAVLAGLEAFKASDDWRKDGGAFIPAPLVWLNQRRWEAIEQLPPEQPTSGVVEAKEFLARFDRLKAEMTPPPADLMRRIGRAA